MIERQGLRRRLAIALTSLAALAVGMLGLAFWLGEAIIEESNLQRLMARELDFLIASNVSPAGTDPRSATLNYYRPALRGGIDPPSPLAGLAAGPHPRVYVDGVPYYVLVQHVGEGDTAYLAYDISIADRRERWLLGILAGGVLLVVLAAWMMSGRVARQTLRPLDDLVTRIRALDIGRRAERLPPMPGSELDVIVTALNAHLAQLEALVESETAFAAAASHELRTHLAVIGGAADVLGARDPAAQPVTARIDRAVVEARAELDALLALSRTRDPPPEESCALHEWLPRLAEPYAGETRLEWSLTPVRREISTGALAVIFTNLIRNAVRAAPEGTVSVKLESAGITVRDDGDGMSPQMLARAFEPGTRGTGGGSGLGLYISQQLAMRCGWRIALDSEPGKGTRARLLF
ncbi:MAG: sensor histidine kinase [Gammaproteobacteria bacterium]